MKEKERKAIKRSVPSRTYLFSDNANFRRKRMELCFINISLYKKNQIVFSPEFDISTLCEGF